MTFKPHKRVNKDGSVTYWTRLDAGLDPVTGKRLQPRLNAPTVAELKRLYAEAVRQKDAGGFTTAGRQTVADYLDYWLETYARGATKPGTYDRYRQVANAHIKPAVGTVRLDKLTPTHLASLYRAKLDGGRLDGKPGGLSPRTVRYIHATLHEALGHAVRWGLLTRNVADAVDAPRLDRTEMHYWDVDQVSVFLDAAAGSRFAPIFELAILTGLRRGELLGLRWQDLDLDAGRLTVRQTLIDKSGHITFSSPKTYRSRRPVALSESAVALLKRHKRDQNLERLRAGEGWTPSDLVFTSELGTPVQPRNLYRAFSHATQAARLPKIRFHDLRHSHATLLFAADVHPKIVSERLGHATVGFTLDVYAHVVPGMQDEAAGRLDALLAGRRTRTA